MTTKQVTPINNSCAECRRAKVKYAATCDPFVPGELTWAIDAIGRFHAAGASRKAVVHCVRYARRISTRNRPSDLLQNGTLGKPETSSLRTIHLYILFIAFQVQVGAKMGVFASLIQVFW